MTGAAARGLLALWLTTVGASAAGAQPPAPEAPADTDASAADDETETEPEDTRVAPRDRVRWRPLPSVRIGRRLRFDVKFRTQGDVRDSPVPGEVTDEDEPRFDLARRRLGVEGRAFGVIDFEVEAELTSDEPWRDVFASYRARPFLQIQGGHFRLPFSLDQLTGATNRDFISRSLAARQLAPGRDPGVMLHGRVRRVLRYEAGVFRQDGRNARTRNPERVSGGRTLAGRLVVQPWRGQRRSTWEDLQVGVAATTADVPEGRPALRGETVFEAVFFRPDTPVLGARRRQGVEARWRPGPFSLAAEYIRVTTEREGQGVRNDDLSPLLATGWYVSGTWVLTGEAKADGLRAPRRSVFRGGPGALELAARIERLAFGSTARGEAPSSSPRADVVAPNANRALTLGLNWYLNRLLKVQANLVREQIDDVSRSPVPGRGTFWSRGLLFQLAL